MIATASTVQDKLQQYFDSSYGSFAGWGATNADMLSRWADIADLLLSNVVPASTTSPAARLAFISTLSPAMGALSIFTPVLISAFQQYAITLSGGMVPAGFNGTPPPYPPPIVFTGLVTRSATIEMANLSVVLYTWALTGTAVNIGTSATVSWT